jgi:hypothetical protein
MRATDDQDHQAAGFQKGSHAAKRGLRIGKVLQKMCRRDEIMTTHDQGGAFQGARNQAGAALAQPRLGSAQHGW